MQPRESTRNLAQLRQQLQNEEFQQNERKNNVIVSGTVPEAEEEEENDKDLVNVIATELDMNLDGVKIVTKRIGKIRNDGTQLLRVTISAEKRRELLSKAKNLRASQKLNKVFDGLSLTLDSQWELPMGRPTVPPKNRQVQQQAQRQAQCQDQPQARSCNRSSRRSSRIGRNGGRPSGSSIGRPNWEELLASDSSRFSLLNSTKLCEVPATNSLPGDYMVKDVRRRKEELLASCEILGIPRRNVTLYRCTNLPDNPRVDWGPNLLAALILKTVSSLSCDMVLTFDNKGVSGHKNHTALFSAVQLLVHTLSLPPDVPVYTLQTCGTLAKYLYLFTVPYTYTTSQHACVLSWKQSRTVVRAMRQHRSQMLWFRHLYLWFSSYLLLNVLQPLPTHVERHRKNS
ncbi:unnamed protein product [Cyprideis torosa]|uniref:N-acetylglucosaminylphosphatidylinositol deacetylase n=1 Tax=Cyprideis torosa TaxID=163714 RepID=A0A7R8ZRW0_9CRUS|nr:unnamed protein product [Cyprideis torosa]CAG0900052.1 unnamed protein product [Cyprideis torosa]